MSLLQASPEAFQAHPEFDEIFLREMAPFAEKELARHDEQRKEWSYHDILTRDVLADLASQEPVDIDPLIARIYMGNLLVEKGHAEYARITSELFEEEPAFRKWKNRWVSEEEQHGAGMLEWAKVRGLFDMTKYEESVRGFQRAGLSLNFGDAAYGFAYPALQEPATKITHREVKDRLPEEETEGRRILAKIVGDEQRHELFYANMARHALHSGETSLASHQMRAVGRAMLGFEMPGIERDIPGGIRITAAYIRTGAFTVGKVAQEVLLPAIEGTGVHGWDVENVETLDDDAREVQADIVAFRDKLLEIGQEDKELLEFIGETRLKIAA